MRWAAVRLAAWIALPLLAASTAHAQAYQCSIPQGPLSAPAIAADGPERRSAITGYTLALSWSPEFCRKDTTSIQCSGQHGRFGMVVHGLWPEGRGGNWPQWCRTMQRPSSETLRRHLCMSPSPRLMAHEWAKHGSCMVRHPETYFKMTGILWRSLRLPDLDRLSRREGLTAGVLRAAFAEANPGWKAGAIGLVTSRNGWLQEIHLCYDKGFMPAACDQRRFGPDHSAPLKIWRGI